MFETKNVVTDANMRFIKNARLIALSCLAISILVLIADIIAVNKLQSKLPVWLF